MFGPETTQKELYDGAALKLLADNAVEKGINGTVFAYGPTGAGKTFTMLGNETEPGVMFRLLTDVFGKIRELSDQKITVDVSYLEVNFMKQLAFLVLKKKLTI